MTSKRHKEKPAERPASEKPAPVLPVRGQMDLFPLVELIKADRRRRVKKQMRVLRGEGSK